MNSTRVSVDKPLPRTAHMTYRAQGALAAGLDTVRSMAPLAVRSVHVPNLREPPGLCRNDGKWPHGITLIPFERGKSLVWDGTVVDTVAPSYADACSGTPGNAVTN